MIVNDNVGSKYRYIILAGQRVSQLQKGARPRMEGMEDEKNTTIATRELSSQLLTFHKIDGSDLIYDNSLDTFIPPSDPNMGEST